MPAGSAMTRAPLTNDQAILQLLLDSIETLAGRDGTQNELVRAILARSSRGKLVVLAIRSQGSSLPPLAAGLQGAIERGTLVNLASPEWELRVAIVIRRAGGWGVRLSPEAASFVVGRLGSSLTGVDALLTRLMTRTHESADLSVAEAVTWLEIPALKGYHCEQAHGNTTYNHECQSFLWRQPNAHVHTPQDLRSQRSPIFASCTDSTLNI